VVRHKCVLLTRKNPLPCQTAWRLKPGNEEVGHIKRNRRGPRIRVAGQVETKVQRQGLHTGGDRKDTNPV